MKYRFFLPIAFALMLFTISFTACTKDDSTTETENFVNNALDEICTETRTGKNGCFEIIFPVTVVFADSTTQEVTSYDEMKAAFKAWRENNPEVKGRPKIQFPYSVTTEDGTIVEITSAEDLKALIAGCVQDGGGPGHGPGKGGHGPGHGGHGKPCFTINFPLTVTTANGEVALADQAALKELLKSLKGTGKKPQFVFPITITLEDGTVQTVNSAEELRAIKEACRG